MDKLILDPQRSLADEVIEFSSDRSLEPWQRDELAMKELQKHKEKEGHAFFIFLDSTHSEYSFPKDFPLKHTPISSEINYLTIHAQSPDLELLKNRYRNSIAYIDSLFAELFDFMKKEELFDSAIISIAADHGEEFFEDGALFHGTHLNDYQTSVPILLKFPSSDWVPQTDTVTHIDLFPSILHYLTKQSDFSSFCEGKSIFAFEKNRRRVAVLQNGNLDPEELLIDGELRVKTCEEGLEVLSGTLEPGALDFLLEKGPFGPPKGEISSIPAGAGSK